MEQDLKKFLIKFGIEQSEFDGTKLKWDDLLKIANDYEKTKDDLDPTAKYVIDRLLKLSEVHSVRYRIKNTEHLIAKIIRKTTEKPDRKIDISNYKKEITDLIGIRVLHLFKEDWIKIHEFIDRTWELIETQIAYIREGDTDDFKKIYNDKKCDVQIHPKGYRSVHYLIKSKPSRYEFISEIQVRTIFEEGWSEIDHKLRYHNDVEDLYLTGFLGILNRLAGSSDEMASFIVYLRNGLNNIKNKHKEIDEGNKKIIDDLKKEIEKLKLTPSKHGIFTEALNNLRENVEMNKLWDNSIAAELQRMVAANEISRNWHDIEEIMRLANERRRKIEKKENVEEKSKEEKTNDKDENKDEDNKK